MGEDFKLTSHLTLGREYKCYFRTKVCNVEGCKSESVPNVLVSYYSLPSNPKLAQEWLQALNLEEAPYNFIVCSNHFRDDDFSATLKTETMTFRLMKSNAVPNRNLPGSAVEYQVPFVNSEHEYAIKKEIIEQDNDMKVSLDNIKPIFIKMDGSKNCESNNTIEESGQHYIFQYDDTASAVNSIINTDTGINIEDMNANQEHIVQQDTKSHVTLPKRRKKVQKQLQGFKITSLTMDEQIEQIQNRALTSNYINAAYKCDLCYKGYMTENTYNTHMDKHGEQSGPFECAVCHRRFHTRLVLRRHMTKHSIRHSCEKCEFMTPKRVEAEAHSCVDGVRYGCDLCNEVFGSVSSLTSHAKTYHPTIHVCEICGFSFLGLKGLNHHTRFKHGGEGGDKIE